MMSSPVTPVVSSFRRILPQILACVAKSLVLLGIGLALGFPSTFISALSKKDNGQLHFSLEEASWFASLIYISQPVGCILSGYLTDRLGRKNAMILVNVPHIGAWLLIHVATNLTQIYTAAIILGLGIGVMETPVVTYIGEICQPSIRGILTATTGVAVTLGYTIVYSLGWMVSWRSAALICFSVPLVTILVILFVPETPLWYLMHNRVDEARTSLQWLRGWVPAAAVQNELKELQRYCAAARRCKLCQEDDADCGCSRDTWRQRWGHFTATQNLKPFCIVTMFLVFAQLSGFTAMRPYLVPILKRYDVPMDPDKALSIIGLLKLSANLSIMASVKWAGKRMLSLVSVGGVVLCTASLAIYAFWWLPESTPSSGLFPLVNVCVLAFMTSLGCAPIPWMLLSEVLPVRTRAVTSGVTVTINYLVAFLATKTYPALETLLDVHGVLLMYFCFGAMGFVFLLAFLPETENRTLEEIEHHFATQPITERFIQQMKEERNGGEVCEGGESSEKKDDDRKCREDLELL